MKKRDKFKNFMKKTLFGEKLENALQKKTEIEKSPPIIEAKKSSSPMEKTYTEKKSHLENVSKSSELSSKTESDANIPLTKNILKAEKINAFLQIMESRFLENMSSDSPIRVNLGIDLGTSYSKVVWRLGENSYPLCFGNNHLNLNDYLVPSMVSFGKKTLIWSDEISEEDALFSLANFKMCLACESEKSEACNIKKCSLTKWNLKAFNSELAEEETAFVNAFFLAKLLANTKKLITVKLEEMGFSQPLKVKWLANFSVPEKFIEHLPVSKAFDKVFKIAWLMAEIFTEKPDLCNRATISECYLTAKNLVQKLELQQKPFDCFSYSEIGAEVASIVLSRISEPGLYAFVDIGAGTVDASVFRFWRDGAETQRPPYSADVFRIGAAHIETRANRHLLKNSVNWLKDIKEKYFETTENEREQFLQPIVSYLKESEQSIETEVYENLKKVLREAFKKERNIDKWMNLKLILGGGGAKLKTYQDAAIRAFTLSTKPPEINILPQPDDFQSVLTESEFNRFAVAYGLSHEIVNLPETVFAKDVLPLHQLRQQNMQDRDADR